PAGLSEGYDQLVVKGEKPGKQARLAFVPGTSSEYLAISKARSSQDITFRLIGARDLDQAVEWFQTGQVQGLALWEPWTSAEGARSLAATSKAQPLAYVWVASRQLLDGRSGPRAGQEEFRTFAQAWFGLIGQLDQQTGLIKTAIAEENDLPPAELDNYLKNFRFLNLEQATAWATDSAQIESQLADLLRIWSLGGAPNIRKTDYHDALAFSLLFELGEGAPPPSEAPEETETPDEILPGETPEATETAETGMMFAANPAHTGVYAGKAVTEQNEIVWKARMRDDVRCSPAIAGNRLFVGSDDGTFYCYDTDKGRRVWDFKVGEKVRSSPALAGEMVLFGANDGTLYALSTQDGNKVWTFPTNDQILGPVTVSDNLVYFTSMDKKIYALSMAGQLEWEHDCQAGLTGGVAVADGKAYAADLEGRVFCLSADKGAEIWTETVGGPVAATPVVDGATVYLTTRRGTVHALDARTGTERWKGSVEGPIEASPAISQGVLVFGAKDTNVYGFDAVTGKEKWRHRTRGAVTTSACIAGEVAYVGSEDSRLYALQIDDGRRLWRFKIPNGWVF
ncbi:MAG: PQQ-binding-like beta-propeller repeat protein, partial [Candidatus Eremiobacteraeota bacterium]|nr:PQQ-binding-like beta-propeller repeat protein [Candidatus Eremiobacteraeota bacterium]